jgi:hypothetical protein
VDTWYKVTISKQEIIEGKHLSLLQEFHALQMANHATKDAAMFTNPGHDFPRYYFFSPGAVRIAQKLINTYGGVSCNAPLATDVNLTSGDTLQLKNIPFATS